MNPSNPVAVVFAANSITPSSNLLHKVEIVITAYGRPWKLRKMSLKIKGLEDSLNISK